MVEMNETASILNNISNRSLILLDEIGRERALMMVFQLPGRLLNSYMNTPYSNPKSFLQPIIMN